MNSQTNAPNASNSDPRTFKGEGCMGQLEAGSAISGSLNEVLPSTGADELLAAGATDSKDALLAVSASALRR